MATKKSLIEEYERGYADEGTKEQFIRLINERIWDEDSLSRLLSQVLKKNAEDQAKAHVFIQEWLEEKPLPAQIHKREYESALALLATALRTYLRGEGILMEAAEARALTISMNASETPQKFWTPKVMTAGNA